MAEQERVAWWFGRFSTPVGCLAVSAAMDIKAQGAVEVIAINNNLNKIGDTRQQDYRV